MVDSTRLERLSRLVQPDLDTLPDQPMRKQPAIDNDKATGGVSLEVFRPSSPSASKQTASNQTVKVELAPTQETPDLQSLLVKTKPSSYNPGVVTGASVTPPLSTTKLPATDLQRGDLVSARHHFTPIQALARYPYRFCNKEHSQNIASAFFDAGKFWHREWDLYYIWDVEPQKPLILVRENQSQDFLKEINSRFNLTLRITDAQREEGFVSRFPDHPDCLPRYLGRSRSRDQFNEMVDKVPSKGFRAAGEHPQGPPETGTLEQFKQLMEELWDVQKAKSKANKARKQQERLNKQRSMTDSFKRAQGYLGLRATEGASRPSALTGAINTSHPAPFEFDRTVVFVCVDIESYERAHHKITEVGVATLDTRDLVGNAPGKDGEAWRKIIKARHFRIKEHRHLVNSEFIQGCPDHFDYGESTLVPLKEAPTWVAACFQPPFSVHLSNTAEEEILNMLRKTDLDEQRNIVFLGHDTLQDVRYLQQLGYDPLKVENIIEVMDTATMYRVWRREQNASSLGRILHNFEIAGWNLHNAGNDAMFTIQVMLAICVREASIRGTPELEAMREQDKAHRLAAAHDAAEQRAKDDAEGWSDVEV